MAKIDELFDLDDTIQTINGISYRTTDYVREEDKSIITKDLVSEAMFFNSTIETLTRCINNEQLQFKDISELSVFCINKLQLAEYYYNKIYMTVEEMFSEENKQRSFIIDNFGHIMYVLWNKFQR